MTYQAESYDIAVVGAGHAGIEAGLAAARMGLKTVVFTINLDAVGNMPCNPAIGGTGTVSYTHLDVYKRQKYACKSDKKDGGGIGFHPH